MVNRFVRRIMVNPIAPGYLSLSTDQVGSMVGEVNYEKVSRDLEMARILSPWKEYFPRWLSI